jgi:hypothetical protein
MALSCRRKLVTYDPNGRKLLKFSCKIGRRRLDFGLFFHPGGGAFDKLLRSLGRLYLTSISHMGGCSVRGGIPLPASSFRIGRKKPR